MRESPLHVQTFDLAAWLLKHLEGSDPLTARIHVGALDLTDAVVLALRGIDRESAVRRADVANAVLRVHLRLANRMGRFDDRRLLFLTGELDAIGRQIGGWSKRLARATVDARPR